MAVHEYRCALRWSDMDAYGHVNNSVFLTYLEEARVDLLVGAGGEAGRRMLDVGVLVQHHAIDYVAPLVFRPEPVTIEVWTASARAASCEVAYRVCDGDLTYATAVTRLVAYDLAAQQVRRFDDGERALLEHHLRSS
jgi:acyl-CoA thioester hydrolase